jgi:organic radical activating enzyme
MNSQRIPIKVSKKNTSNYYSVEWMLGNTCNYDCSFCSSEIKDGSQRWLKIEDYISTCARLIAQAERKNKKIVFQFTGGEPTLFKDFIQLIEFIKEKGHYVNLISNGSRTLRWWKELADKNLINYLFISVHTEQDCDIEHIINVVNLFKNSFTLCAVTCIPEYFEKTVYNLNKIKDNADCLVSLKPIIVNNKEDCFLDYSEEQLAIIKNNTLVQSKNYTVKFPGYRYDTLMEVEYSDNYKFKSSAPKLVTNKMNYFFNWKCSIGTEYLNIIYDKIYRGKCLVGGPIGTIYEDVGFVEDWVTCPFVRCVCSTDLIETKIR